jgi:hypothetical protein
MNGLETRRSIQVNAAARVQVSASQEFEGVVSRKQQVSGGVSALPVLVFRPVTPNILKASSQYIGAPKGWAMKILCMGENQARTSPSVLLQL